jgi:hypothetical protein
VQGNYDNDFIGWPGSDPKDAGSLRSKGKNRAAVARLRK